MSFHPPTGHRKGEEFYGLPPYALDQPGGMDATSWQVDVPGPGAPLPLLLADSAPVRVPLSACPPSASIALPNVHRLRGGHVSVLDVPLKLERDPEMDTRHVRLARRIYDVFHLSVLRRDLPRALRALVILLSTPGFTLLPLLFCTLDIVSALAAGREAAALLERPGRDDLMGDELTQQEETRVRSKARETRVEVMRSLYVKNRSFVRLHKCFRFTCRDGTNSAQRPALMAQLVPELCALNRFQEAQDTLAPLLPHYPIRENPETSYYAGLLLLLLSLPETEREGVYNKSLTYSHASCGVGDESGIVLALTPEAQRGIPLAALQGSAQQFRTCIAHAQALAVPGMGRYGYEDDYHSRQIVLTYQHRVQKEALRLSERTRRELKVPVASALVDAEGQFTLLGRRNQALPPGRRPDGLTDAEDEDPQSFAPESLYHQQQMLFAAARQKMDGLSLQTSTWEKRDQGTPEPERHPSLEPETDLEIEPSVAGQRQAGKGQASVKGSLRLSKRTRDPYPSGDELEDVTYTPRQTKRRRRDRESDREVSPGRYDLLQGMSLPKDVEGEFARQALWAADVAHIFLQLVQEEIERRPQHRSRSRSAGPSSQRM